jgi:hypothetical protein
LEDTACVISLILTRLVRLHTKSPTDHCRVRGDRLRPPSTIRRSIGGY